MKQQINLFQPMFRKQKKVFSAAAMLQIIGFFIVIYAGIYGYNNLKLEPFREEIKRADLQFNKLTEQIAMMEKKFPQKSKSKLLENEVARLNEELEYRKKIKQALADGSYGNVDGFSAYFEAFAKGHVEGTWLTGINIAQGGRQLSFMGKTINPELVPVYLQQLSGLPVLKKRSFNVLELQRPEDKQDYISFNVATGR